MIILGLSGSIGTGKSTVARFFRELGGYVIDWDVLGHEVIEPHKRAWQGIIDYFGRDVLNDDLTINRQRLGAKVFGKRDELDKLNSIVHPVIFEEDERITHEIAARDPDAVIVKDIPLLIREQVGNGVDKVVIVVADEETQIGRLAAKGLSREEAIKRIRSQEPLGEKVRWADYIIHNNGTFDDTKRQVTELYSALTMSKEVKQW